MSVDVCRGTRGPYCDHRTQSARAEDIAQKTEIAEDATEVSLAIVVKPEDDRSWSKHIANTHMRWRRDSNF
jgi:hypothetical protein